MKFVNFMGQLGNIMGQVGDFIGTGWKLNGTGSELYVTQKSRSSVQLNMNIGYGMFCYEREDGNKYWYITLKILV